MTDNNESKAAGAATGMDEFFTRGKANEGVQLPLYTPDGSKSEHWVRVLGQNMATSTAIVTGATYNPATTTSPLDSFTGTLQEAGVPIAVITEISLSLENALEARFVVGSKQSIRPSIGRSNVTGQVTAYFENSALLDKFINETESSIVFELPDGAGNKYTFTLPRIKYTGGQPDVDGEGPITLAMPFQALLDPTTGTNIRIDKM